MISVFLGKGPLITWCPFVDPRDSEMERRVFYRTCCVFAFKE